MRVRVNTNLLFRRSLRKTIAFVNKIYALATTNYSYLQNLRYKRLRSRFYTRSYRYQLIIQWLSLVAFSQWRTFSTTSTYLVKHIKMFPGIVLIINKVSVEWALVSNLLVGIRQWHSYFIPLFVACAFPCKSKVSFDILEMCHRGTQEELEFVEF